MFTLRDYQMDAVQGVRNTYLRGFRAPLLVLATGGGKTIIFTYIAQQTAAKGKRVLIIVHRIELLRQTANKLRAFGVRVGLISPKYAPDYSAPVQVAMVQTMVKRFGRYPEFDLIITDEAHHAVAGQYVQVVGAYPDVFQLGVTATPVRGDGKGLGISSGGPFDSMVMGPSTAELIQRGFLVKPIVFGSEIQPDLKGVRMRMGDYNKKQLNEAMDKPKITGNAVDHYKSICDHQPAVAFCVSILHAEHVAAEFRAAGYKAYAVSGQTEDAVRDRILNGLGDGSVDVVCSCDLISEGTDIPAITGAILLRPTQSLGLYIQQVGRALRPSEGKENAFVLDHVGNVGQYIDGQFLVKHGFPDDEREWSLDGEVKKDRGKKKKKDQVVPVSQCKECFAVFPIQSPVCTQCGAPKRVDQKEMPQATDGQLVEISDRDKQNAVRMKMEKRREVGAARTLEQLQKIAAERGYKKGWAIHVYNSRNR